MSRAGNPALQTTSDWLDAIAVIRWDTTHMNAVSPVQNPAVLSTATVHQPEELEDEGPKLLQRHNSEADHQKMDGVSRGGAPY